MAIENGQLLHTNAEILNIKHLIYSNFNNRCTSVFGEESQHNLSV